MGWFECHCGEIFCCRTHDVKTNKTRSCGCVGREKFISHFERRSSNLSAALRDKIFAMTHSVKRRQRTSNGHRIRWTERQTREDVARIFNLDRYLVDFVISARCRFIRALANMGQAGWNLLTRVERSWYCFQEYKASQNAERERDLQTFEALPMAVKLEKLAEERQIQSTSKTASKGPRIDLQALLLDPHFEVTFVDFNAAREVLQAWS
jgi:hypothetical protein